MKGDSKMSRFLIIPCLNEIEKSIQLAEEYNFGFEYNDFYLPDVLDNDKEIDRIVNAYSSYKLPGFCTCHGAFLDVTVFSSDKLIREISEHRVRQSIEAARKANARSVIFHTNINPQLTAYSYTQNWLDRNTNFWSGILCEYPDMNIYIENMFDNSPNMLEKLAKKLCSYSNFGVCLDYAHANVFGNVDIDCWVKSLAPYVKHIHINDNNLEDDLHLAVGAGRIDWQQFKEYLIEYFSDCSILIETSSIEAQRASAVYLKSIGVLH
jgi:sugar phosphate isomerase/epimerase